MISQNLIDSHIEVLLDYLESIQNEDGSFDRMIIYSGLNLPEAWNLFNSNTHFDTAIPLIPLCFMDSEKSNKIIQNGIKKIRKKNLDNFIWTWQDSIIVPYCTDDTSACSFILERNGYSLKNKEFLNEFIDENNHYLFFILPRKKSKNIPLLTFLKLVFQNRKILKSKYFLDDQMCESDNEFTSTCINLLYLNKMESNKKVWSKIKEQFNTGEIDYTYYIDIYHSFYCYARLYAYGNHDDLLPRPEILNKYINELYNELNIVSNSPRHLLLMNSLLFFNINLDSHVGLLNQCFDMINKELFKNNTVYYSSNNKRPLNSKDNKPFVYFGSSAINCSLYLEFLNLYRKRVYCKYYGEV